MIHRSRLTRLALATAILFIPFAACAKPAEEAAPVVEAAPAPAVEAPAAPAEAAAPAGEPAAAAAMQAAPPPPPQARVDVAAVTTINLSNCETNGNKGQTTVIDWQPTDPSKPVEVRWLKQGNGQGLRVVIKPIAVQSPDPIRNGKILAMFDARYEIAPDADSVVSGLPENPPFEANEVRWKYQVQVLNPQGNVICGLDPEVCVRLPGGCGI